MSPKLLTLLGWVLFCTGLISLRTGWRPYHLRPAPNQEDTSPIDALSEPHQKPIDPEFDKLILMKSSLIETINQSSNKLGDQILVEPVAHYDIAAQVAKSSRYYFDSFSSISPVDLLLMWGETVTHQKDCKFSFTQVKRFGYWSYHQECPLGTDYLIAHTANTHFIPANRKLSQALKSIQAGELVQIQGYLVNVSILNAEPMNTSLVRTDTGPGACEIMYVKKLKIGSQVFF